MYLRKADELRKLGNFISIHWDRLGGWSNFLNYRRDHFAYIDHPLTFDQEGRVCIHTQFTNYELFDAYRLQVNQGGLFHEAAGMKVYGWSKIPNKPAGHEYGGQFFLASLVAGGSQEGSFKPIELGGFVRAHGGGAQVLSDLVWKYRVAQGCTDPGRDSDASKTTANGFACPVQIQYFYRRGIPRVTSQTIHGTASRNTRHCGTGTSLPTWPFVSRVGSRSRTPYRNLTPYNSNVLAAAMTSI